MPHDPRPGGTRRNALAVSMGVAVGTFLGIAIGVGGYTFVYAEGASYFSTRPEACVNCHIMRPQYDDWQKASHHAVASCVDCHLPASGVSKWWAKAVNGYNHSKAFTLQDFAEPITISPRNAAILEANCLRCHGDLVHDLAPAAAGRADDLRCVHCHATAGHGPRTGLGGRDRGVEAETRR